MTKDFKIHFLNTIWSDSMMLESDNHFALVDTASKFYYPMVKEYIEKMRNGKEDFYLDFILLTHFHSDHFGNMVNVLTDYKVKKIYLKEYTGREGDTGAGYPTNEEYVKHQMDIYNEIIKVATEKGVEIIYLDKYEGEPYIIDFNGVNIELYNLKNNLELLYNDSKLDCYQKHLFSENSNSILSFIKFNNYNICLAADLTESDSPYELINRLNENVIKKIYERHNIDHIDVLKSPHHGGSGTNKESFGLLVKAKYIVITNTDKWLNNWSTRDNLRKGNPDVCLLQTDYHQYIFDFSKENIEYQSIDYTSLFIEMNKE